MRVKSVEVIFIIFAFVFGLIIMFLTPKFGVSDEPTHFVRAQEVSGGVLYNKLPQNLTMKEINNLKTFHGASGYSPIMYAFSGMSLKLTKNFDENVQFYTGRFVNLLVWIILIAFAIHITPVFKWAFFLCALFPMSIYEGMSYSADSFSNAFAFLYFAYLFKLIYGDRVFSYKRDLPVLIMMSLIGALCKGLVVQSFLTLLIPIKKNKYPICIGIILISLLVSVLWSSNNFIALAENADNDFNRHFIMSHPIMHLKMILNTYLKYFPNFLGHMVGKLGWQKIFLSRVVYVLTYLAVIGTFLFIPEKAKIKLSHKVLAFLLIIFYLISTASLMFCMCNGPNEMYIAGMQGRYFISILPLAFLILGHNFSKIRYDNFKVIICGYTFFLLVYTCLTLYNVIQNFGSEYFFV